MHERLSASDRKTERHTDCDYLILKGMDLTFAAAGEKTFSFNASPYTQEELTTKKHSYELQPCGSTVVCLDYAQNGIGSNSCGPELRKEYQFTEETFTFDMKFFIWEGMVRARE